MKRCFIALRIRDEARQRLAAVAAELREQPRRAARKIRPVKGPNLHVTLKFLGPTPDAQVPEVIEALTEVSADFGAITSDIVGLGAFPTPARPRVLWAGLGRERERVIDLMTRVDEACEILGFEPERPDRRHPHVTIARVERPQPKGPLSEFIAAHDGERFGDVEGSAVVLFESELNPAGAVYTSLADVPL